VIVTKNSGGLLTHAKLIAARRLGLRVIMVERREVGGTQNVADVKGALELILRHQSALAVRDV
jgi:precorrin-6A/cobalt-precorrin-6A reductase